MSPSARHTFFAAMMSHGFTMLRLHKVDADGVCQCRQGRGCQNPGRHFDKRYGWQSVIKDIDELEQHLDDGGSVGLSLWYEDNRIPQSPGRLVVFDCDEAAAAPWLRSKGITSPLMVVGRRGVHVYCRMPAETPLLKSDTRTLRTPKVDIKVSGLVLTPWSPDKRLLLYGEDVTENPEAISAFLGDYTSLMDSLPEVDPRILVPDMTERYPQVCPATPAPIPPRPIPAHVDAPAPERPSTRRVRLSDKPPTSFYAGYLGLPYNRRKSNASSHAQNVLPSIVGKAPWQKLEKVVADCILHYGMSDQDTWKIIRDKFNPRCLDRNGKKYPWRMAEVAWAIGIAHQPGSYSTLDQVRGDVDISNALAHERSRGERANARRVARQLAMKNQDFANIRMFLSTYYEPDASARLPFRDLLVSVNRALVLDEFEAVTRQRLGRLLKEDGIQVVRGMVLGIKVKVCDDPSTCMNTLRYTLCPSAPCTLIFQGGV